jgi:hypothetical protein
VTQQARDALGVTSFTLWGVMAPPKRKAGGGRTTPAEAARTAASGAVGASARYTPPVPHSAKESPPWVPVLMLGLFVLGAVAIMLRYLVFPDSNIPLLIGLVCLLGGLFTATKWR